jgi:hypothetical protein
MDHSVAAELPWKPFPSLAFDLGEETLGSEFLQIAEGIGEIARERIGT